MPRPLKVILIGLGSLIGLFLVVGIIGAVTMAPPNPRLPLWLPRPRPSGKP